MGNSFIYKSHFLFNGNSGTRYIGKNLECKDFVSAGGLVIVVYISLINKLKAAYWL